LLLIDNSLTTSSSLVGLEIFHFNYLDDSLHSLPAFPFPFLHAFSNSHH
jgi:hypothetical protein